MRVRVMGGFAGAVCAAAVAMFAVTSSASADIVLFSDSSGLSALAEFTMLNATTLQVRLQNTSTGTPAGFNNAGQILTGLSWDFGAPGSNGGDPTITGGSVIIGPSSNSVNFDSGSYGPGTDVSGEWGYGNTAQSGAMVNGFSSVAAGVTAFGSVNLDGPAALDGPQGGLVANPILIPLAGLGAIQNEIIATLTLSAPIANLGFLANGARIEFGSDVFFIDGNVPAPGAASLLALAGLLVNPRRRRA